MEDMKWDMGGAGAVVGAHAGAGRRARPRSTPSASSGLVENMPVGNAQRPGDVVKSMSGQTIEVINTDAEGRLVLADALWYCQDRFKPQADDRPRDPDRARSSWRSATSMPASSPTTTSWPTACSPPARRRGELLWRMPLAEAYDKQINSDAADMKNVGGRRGGSITAAQFIQRFVNDTPWAHLDIAGIAWSDEGSSRPSPKGATAFGVRLLDRLVADALRGGR